MGNKRNRVAHRRSLYTHESYTHVIEAWNQAEGEAPIPVASLDQAALEALVLERVGEVSLDLWEPTVLPFGISWVSPRPHSLDLGIPYRYLPDIIRQTTPTVPVEDLSWNAPTDDDVVEVQGIPGLRLRHEAGHAVLYRPSLPGSIRIRATEPVWKRASWIARHPWSDRVISLWDGHPHDWHPLEIRYLAEGWPGRYQIGGEHYRASRLASDLLRRLPGICRSPSSHDMWFNFHGRTDAEYHIQLEWELGEPPAHILDLLLDPLFGIDIDIELTPAQAAREDCYNDNCSWVRLVSRDGTRSRIDLRRLMYPTPNDEIPSSMNFHHRRQAERQELEMLYPSG